MHFPLNGKATPRSLLNIAANFTRHKASANHAKEKHQQKKKTQIASQCRKAKKKVRSNFTKFATNSRKEKHATSVCVICGENVCVCVRVCVCVCVCVCVFVK
jgi:hypothetical protein